MEQKNKGNPIKLKELIEALDLQSNSLSFFVHQQSGEIVYLTEDEIASVENEEEEKTEDLVEAASVLNSDAYIPLPTEWDLDGYRMMVDFINSIENDTVRNDLERAIEGKGAFGRFKAAICCHKIENRWYQFKYEQLQEIAIAWCDTHQLAYEA